MIDYLLDLMRDHSYTVFNDSKHLYNLNLVALRKKPYEWNFFNDTLHVFWRVEHNWMLRSFPITTLPGEYWLQHLMNPKGAAILVPGQYRGVYKLGPYKGGEALKQVRNLAVYRDNNMDSDFDIDSDTIEKGLFGLHIHRAGYFSSFVDNYSAGCQVFQRQLDFDNFIWLCHRALPLWGNSFSYTLIEV